MMPIEIDQIITTVEVDVEPEQTSGEPRRFEAQDRLRALQARLDRERLRTATEGFDD